MGAAYNPQCNCIGMGLGRSAEWKVALPQQRGQLAHIFWQMSAKPGGKDDQLQLSVEGGPMLTIGRGTTGQRQVSTMILRPTDKTLVIRASSSSPVAQSARRRTGEGALAVSNEGQILCASSGSSETNRQRNFPAVTRLPRAASEILDENRPSADPAALTEGH